MKKSFVLHIDSLDVLDELSDTQTAILFRAIRNYHKGETTQLDQIMKLVFLPFKNQFIRDNEGHKNKTEANKANGLLGGRPKKPKRLLKNPNNPVGLKKPTLISDSDSDSDSENGSDSKKEKDSGRVFHAPSVPEVIAYFHENGYSEKAAMKAHEYYRVGNWTDKDGKAVRNWKQKMLNNWFKDEYKITVNPTYKHPTERDDSW